MPAIQAPRTTTRPIKTRATMRRSFMAGRERNEGKRKKSDGRECARGTSGRERDLFTTRLIVSSGQRNFAAGRHRFMRVKIFLLRAWPFSAALLMHAQEPAVRVDPGPLNSPSPLSR